MRSALLPLLAGSASFPLVLAFDAAAVRGIIWLKWLCFIGAGALFVFGLAGTIAAPQRFILPAALRAVTGALALVFLLLLIYSLAVEPVFRQALRGGPQTLTTTGTYALARHPGVLWLALFILFLVPASGSKPLLAGAVVWTALNVGVAAVQERRFLPRAFGDAYAAYRSRVPFLVPTRESILQCMATAGRGRREKK